MHNLFNNLSNTVILLAPSFFIGIKGIETFFMVLIPRNFAKKLNSYLNSKNTFCFFAYENMYINSYIKIKIMIVISPTELRTQQRKYLDLAETTKVIVKRKDKLIELVVKERMITEEDVKNSLSLEEVKEQVYDHIDSKFNK